SKKILSPTLTIKSSCDPGTMLLPLSSDESEEDASLVVELKSPEDPLPEESAVSFGVVEQAETNITNKNVYKIL
ncbi:uncharacterized protein METZ01_LOCUS482642, partial [marine metagenome]